MARSSGRFRERRQDRRCQNELWVDVGGSAWRRVYDFSLGGLALRPGLPFHDGAETGLARLSCDPWQDPPEAATVNLRILRHSSWETVFRFIGLPSRAYGTLEGAQRRRSSAGQAVDTGSPILLVEDGKDMAELYRHYLESAGYRTEIADSIRSTLEWVQCGKPRAIILDLGLPDGSGFELLQALRERRIITDAIVVTGDTSSGTAEAAQELGVRLFLTKPVRKTQLLASVESVTELAA